MAKRRKKKASGFILDSSVALAWCFPDEKAAYPQAVLDSLADVTAFVPSLWHLEIANALLMGERGGRCSDDDTAAWTGFLASLPITIDPETMTHAWEEVLALARTHKRTAYDAAYLELARRRALPLATLDKQLRKAATTAGIALYQP